MSNKIMNEEQKFTLLKEHVLRVLEIPENQTLSEADIIKKAIGNIREELDLVKSLSALKSEMFKIVSKNKRNGKSVFPPKKPSN